MKLYLGNVINFPPKNAPDSAATTNTQEAMRTVKEHETGSPEAGYCPSDLSVFVIFRNQQPDKEQSRRRDRPGSRQEALT